MDPSTAFLFNATSGVIGVMREKNQIIAEQDFLIKHQQNLLAEQHAENIRLKKKIEELEGHAATVQGRLFDLGAELAALKSPKNVETTETQTEVSSTQTQTEVSSTQTQTEVSSTQTQTEAQGGVVHTTQAGTQTGNQPQTCVQLLNELLSDQINTPTGMRTAKSIVRKAIENIQDEVYAWDCLLIDLERIFQELALINAEKNCLLAEVWRFIMVETALQQAPVVEEPAPQVDEPAPLVEDLCKADIKTPETQQAKVVVETQHTQQAKKAAKKKRAAKQTAEEKVAKQTAEEKAAQAEADCKSHQEAVRARKEEERRQKARAIADRKAKIQAFREQKEKEPEQKAAGGAKAGKPDTSLLSPTQMDRGENFSRITEKTFLTRSRDYFEFKIMEDDLPILLGLYVLECFGFESWRLRQEDEKFSLIVNRPYEGKKSSVFFHSPWVSAHHIVLWVECADFVECSQLLFKHAPVPEEMQVVAQSTIINAFERIRKNWEFDVLQLRKADPKDMYGLSMQHITVANQSVMTVTILKLILWFHQGRISIMATEVSPEKGIAMLCRDLTGDDA